jgi:hypothetical protein
VPVGYPHRAVTLAASTALVAHQLVDHSRGDVGVLQPGREGMAQVVRPSKVEVGEGGSRNRRLVDPAVVPGRQLGPDASLDVVASTRPAEDQPVWRTADQPPDDRFHDRLGEGHDADARVAFGAVLVARAVAAGVIADVDDFDAASGQVHAALPEPEQLAAAQAGGDLGEEMVAVEAWAGGQELAELLGVVGPSPDPTEDDFWVD